MHFMISFMLCCYSSPYMFIYFAKLLRFRVIKARSKALFNSSRPLSQSLLVCCLAGMSEQRPALSCSTLLPFRWWLLWSHQAGQRKLERRHNSPYILLEFKLICVDGFTMHPWSYYSRTAYFSVLLLTVPSPSSPPPVTKQAQCSHMAHEPDLLGHPFSSTKTPQPSILRDKEGVLLAQSRDSLHFLPQNSPLPEMTDSGNSHPLELSLKLV